MDDEIRRPAAVRREVSFMQSLFNIETEVAHRRREWEREVATTTQVAQLPPTPLPTRWSHLAALILASLRALAMPRVQVPSWNPAGVKCAQTLEGGRASVM